MIVYDMMAVIGHNTFRVFLSVLRAESWPSGSFESSNVHPVSKRKHTAVADCFVRLRVDDGGTDHSALICPADMLRSFSRQLVF